MKPCSIYAKRGDLNNAIADWEAVLRINPNHAAAREYIVTVGVGALAVSTINLEDRITRIGTAAGASAKETNEFKRRLFEVAQMPDIKVKPDSLLAAADTITGTGVSLEYVEANLRTIGLAIQGIGLSGEEAGSIFNTFEKLGFSADETALAMDKLADISDAGKGMGASDLIKALPGLMEVHSAIGDTAGNMEDLFIAMQVLGRGTKSPMKAVSTFTATMQELADPNKRQMLEQTFGVMIRDENTGKMRDFADIMQDLVAKINSAISIHCPKYLVIPPWMQFGPTNGGAV